MVFVLDKHKKPHVVRWFAYYRGLESDEIAAVVKRPREVIEELLEVAP